MAMNRERMKGLRGKGFSYAKIGKLFGISRQRVHQLVSGYGILNDSAKQNGWYGKLRDAVIARDGCACQKCDGTNNLLVHHVDGNDRNNDLGNLITLCIPCHLWLHRPVEWPEWDQRAGAKGDGPRGETKIGMTSAIVYHSPKLWKWKCDNPACGKEWLPRMDTLPRVCHFCQRKFKGQWVEVKP